MSATDTAPSTEEAPGKGRSKLPIVLGLLLAVLLGAGGFAAAYLGVLPLPGGTNEATSEEKNSTAKPMDEVVFVELDPMVVSLGASGRSRHLRFRAQVEVVPGRSDDVRAVMPRVIDTLNGYLRAVPIEELETPSALVLLRSQMLRRVQLVTPEGSVRDLLIMEFVLN